MSIYPAKIGLGSARNICGMAVHGNKGQLLQSFLPGAEASPFSMQNLPFGIFSTNRQRDRRAGVAISDKVLDLKGVSKAGLFIGPILSKSATPGGCFDEVRNQPEPFVTTKSLP